MDFDGIAPECWLRLFLRKPEDFTKWFDRLLSRSPLMAGLSLPALASGKESAVSELDKIRLIVPQTSLVALADIVLSEFLNSFINDQFKGLGDHFYIGARKYTQPLEVAFAGQLMIDKGLDLRSEGCLGQADIQQYFDNLPFQQLVRFCKTRGLPSPNIACVIRHQLITSLYVHVSGASRVHMVRNRARGGLTGSRVALALARIPVEDMCFKFNDVWRTHAFAGTICVATWIDNLFVFGKTLTSTLTVLRESETFLENVWKLKFKPSSKQLMVPFAQPCTDMLEEYPVVSAFKILGHLLIPDGGSQACRDSTIRACWRSFWANVHRSKQQFRGRQVLLGRLNRFVLPVLTFRMPRWSFVESHAKQLDSIQRKMISIILALRPEVGESVEQFVRRRAREVARIQRSQVPWSVRWSRAVLAWGRHVERNTANNCFASHLLEVRSQDELRWRRASFSNRPNTRSFSGFNPRRWLDGLEVCRQKHAPHDELPPSP